MINCQLLSLSTQRNISNVMVFCTVHQEAVIVLVDILLLPLVLVLLATGWRARLAYHQFNEEREHSLQARWQVCVQFGLLLVDILATMLMLIVLVTGVRAPTLISSLLSSGKDFQKLWVLLMSVPHCLPSQLSSCLLCVIAGTHRPVNSSGIYPEQAKKGT